MFGLPVKGFSYPSLMELYEKRPTHNDLVVYIDKRMWKVTEMTLTEMVLHEVRNLTVTETEWIVTEPEVTNYWYMPLGMGSITFPALASE
jgi:hypothetical protein